MNRDWMKVFIAAFFEIFWVIGLKHADNFWTWAGTAIAVFISFYLMIMAGRKLPLGTVYAVFVGLGTAGTVFSEILFFGEPFKVEKALLMFVQSMGMSASQSGLVLTLFTAVQIPVSFILPMVVGRTGNRKNWLLLCVLSELIGVVFLIGYFAPWVAAVFLGFGAGGMFPLAILTPIDEANNVDEATSWSAQMQFGGFMIGAMGPLIFGLALDIFDSFVPAYWVIILILGALSVVILRMEKSKPEREGIN